MRQILVVVFCHFFTPGIAVIADRHAIKEATATEIFFIDHLNMDNNADA